MSTPAPAPDVITVEIKADDDNRRAIINHSHALPTFDQIKARMTPSERRQIRYYSQIEPAIYACRDGITYQRWVDIIIALIEVRERNRKGATAVARTNPTGYLTIGDQIYSLSPLKVVNPTKALTEARKMSLEKCRQDAETIIAQGRITAAGLIAAAKRQKDDADAAMARSAAQQAANPPAWAVNAGLPLMHKERTNEWKVSFVINVKLIGFDLTWTYYDRSAGTSQQRQFTWPALIVENHVPVRLWVGLDASGAYTSTSIHTDAASAQLPHINKDRACMTLTDAPSRIRSLTELNNLADVLTRVHKRVQLNSLLTAPKSWMPAFRSAIPNDLHLALSGDNPIEAVQNLANTNGHFNITSDAQEERETWRL